MGRDSNYECNIKNNIVPVAQRRLQNQKQQEQYSGDCNKKNSNSNISAIAKHKQLYNSDSNYTKYQHTSNS